MSRTRTNYCKSPLLVTLATIGGLAAAWFAGAAPVWQGMHLHP
ncbi:MAG: hypothetical protein ACRDZP_07675 [Acidimicrobiales bacterium]